MIWNRKTSGGTYADIKIQLPLPETDKRKCHQHAVCRPVRPGHVFVVDGHLNNSYLDIGGLFPTIPSTCRCSPSYQATFSGRAVRPVLGRMRRGRRSAFWGLTWSITWYMESSPVPSRGRVCFWGSLNLHNLFIEPFMTDTSLNITWLPGCSGPVPGGDGQCVLRRILGKAAGMNMRLRLCIWGLEWRHQPGLKRQVWAGLADPGTDDVPASLLPVGHTVQAEAGGKGPGARHMVLRSL